MLPISILNKQVRGTNDADWLLLRIVSEMTASTYGESLPI